MKKSVKIILIIVLVLIVCIAAIDVYIQTALPNVGAAPTITVAITPARVERGKYLANHVNACMDCHSRRDWNVYAGPIMEGTFGGGGERFGHEVGFPGDVYSKNITPYGIHRYTDGELFRVITTGETKEGKALFPLMNYKGFGQMDSEDVYSIIAYLRTLPPVKTDVPARKLDFPLSILVNTMPSKANLPPVPDSNNALAYGKYLVTIASCVECHSKVDKGAVIAGSEFGGGREFDFPNNTYVVSANISPDKTTGIGNWTKEAFIQRFKQYADSSYHPQTVAKDGYNTAMPWMMYCGMTEKDLGAIYTYLRTVKPIQNKVQKFGKKS